MVPFPGMQAHRMMIETDDQGRLKNVPALPPHAKVEAIFLVLDEATAPAADRRPPASLAKLEIVGDIVTPAIDEADWAMAS